MGATGRGLRAAEAWAGSALPDARPRALSRGKAASPRRSHPRPATEEGPWLGCSPHSDSALAWVQAPRPPDGSGGACFRKVLMPVPT